MKIEKQLLNNLLSDDECPASIIAAAISMSYDGLDWVNFDFATIFLDLKDNNCRPTQLNKEKIKAAASLFKNDLFLVDWVVFSNICKVFNNRIPVFNVVDPLRPHELIWGIIEANNIDEIEDDEHFSNEVLGYMGAVLKHFDISTLPVELEAFGLKVPTAISVEGGFEKKIEGYKLSTISEYIKDRNEQLESYKKRLI